MAFIEVLEDEEIPTVESDDSHKLDQNDILQELLNELDSLESSLDKSWKSKGEAEVTNFKAIYANLMEALSNLKYHLISRDFSKEESEVLKDKTLPWLKSYSKLILDFSPTFLDDFQSLARVESKFGTEIPEQISFGEGDSKEESYDVDLSDEPDFDVEVTEEQNIKLPEGLKASDNSSGEFIYRWPFCYAVGKLEDVLQYDILYLNKSLEGYIFPDSGEIPLDVEVSLGDYKKELPCLLYFKGSNSKFKSGQVLLATEPLKD